MKNQYAGDQNDYVKFGLLLGLCGAELRPVIAWMLTPNDDRPDGRRRDYARDPRWQGHDPQLHKALGSVANLKRPTLAALERALPLPRATFFGDVVPDRREERAEWSRRQVAAAQGSDLVFFDPDNGFEVKSKPIGRKGSSKYVTWAEVETAFAGGHSVLVYQHYRRVPRQQLASDLMREVSVRTGCKTTVAFRTAHVLFLLAAAPRHRPVLEKGIARVAESWGERVSIQRPPE